MMSDIFFEDPNSSEYSFEEENTIHINSEYIFKVWGNKFNPEKFTKIINKKISENHGKTILIDFPYSSSGIENFINLIDINQVYYVHLIRSKVKNQVTGTRYRSVKIYLESGFIILNGSWNSGKGNDTINNLLNKPLKEKFGELFIDRMLLLDI